MEEMIEHCAQFVNAVNEGLEKPISKEEYIGMMKTYFPQLKRWRKTEQDYNYQTPCHWSYRDELRPHCSHLLAHDSR
jgi:hypothetical protein